MWLSFRCSPSNPYLFACSLKSLETLVKMGERVAVKPGSTFERTNSQKKQLALQTENSTVGISLFQGMSSSDSAMLGGDGYSRSQSEEDVNSAAFAGQQPDGGQGVSGSGQRFDTGEQAAAGSGQGIYGGGQQAGDGHGVSGGGQGFDGSEHAAAGSGQGVVSGGQQPSSPQAGPGSAGILQQFLSVMLRGLPAIFAVTCDAALHLLWPIIACFMHYTGSTYQNSMPGDCKVPYAHRNCTQQNKVSASTCTGQEGVMQQAGAHVSMAGDVEQQSGLQEHAPSIDSAQLQQTGPQPVRHPSEEGISHFDGDDPSPHGTIGDEAMHHVGHDRMSALQASLPVGVSMTHDSSQ